MYVFYFIVFKFRTTEKPATGADDAFLVCADDTCFDPAVIDNEEAIPDLNAAASARLPDDNLRLIFEQVEYSIIFLNNVYSFELI